jgi:hypothetical protein
MIMNMGSLHMTIKSTTPITGTAARKNASQIWSSNLIIWVAQYDEFSYEHNLWVWHHIKKYDASYNINEGSELK